MKNLFQKYFDNNITNEEFQEFKKLLNSSSDKEIEKTLQQLWEEEKGGAFYSQKLLEIKQNIDKTNKKTRHSMFKKSVQIAAAIIVSFIIITPLVYHTGNKTNSVSDMIVAVEEGEKANIILPDSTKVNLNAQSLLSYNINEFNRKERRISFSGEAYFEIAKNNKPFIIQTSHMEVQVVGTSFNLKARDENTSTEIDLLEGKVNLTSNTTKESILLLPHQKAILDKKSGKIKIVSGTPVESTAWRKGQLIFHGVDIKEVFREIERTYGVKIQVNYNDTLPYDIFTGTFSTNNLNETLDVLKLHYQFDYVIKGNKIVIDNFKLNKKKS
ncbi:MAG: FecR family protein [Paludibacteraceae bacterium]|nr:FecR family protein [Paludibacteraceae bacterium]